MNDEFYMSLAISEAWKYQILTYPNPAVGCVVLDKNGKILSVAAHKKAGSLHAEPSAILMALCELSPDFLRNFLNAYNLKFNTDFSDIDCVELLEPNFTYDFILKNHQNLLKDAKAYVTLEPCSHHGKTPPCATLLSALKFKEVVIACSDENKIASGGAQILKNADISVKMGVCKTEANTLLEPFLSWQGGNFSFLKVAMSTNGVATGGLISNELSRAHMHLLRSVCDLLVVGGNTVRIDRPTLDTRLMGNQKSPNVLIYSKSQKFDKTIPLFGVKNRSVKISNELSNLDARLIMFEGAQSFLELAKARKLADVKWLLIYQSSEFKEGKNIELSLKTDPLFSLKFGGNTLWWARIR
ncbi:riboflavin biosynthesis protein RibD [Campylobacter mucosalis]|nr:bifunctional diaminohydroxyphosphoribosylaminopyrimidine deaminase/5-amino-6-(5-phosphoribosylamino)uracil reductase RibD [Campylobacter mucosalis]KEA46077.1 riboflavin biosynthesis protein RibD [Campylobacter mucosalis]QKF63498.1 diaminohydroxyphosphoribosylaminopyrimidine deaminase / 5-amino-6-(5-phosphoribosylamino)uracil reductase [Campylobacter mucosalis]